MSLEKRKLPVGAFEQIDTMQIVKVLWNRKILILFSASICAIATFLFTMFCITPQYKASIMFYVNNSNISLANSGLTISQSDLSAAQSLVDTYIVILNTPETRNAIKEKMGMESTETLDNITASAVNSTEIFRVTVIGDNPDELYKIAGTIGSVLPKRISDVVEGSDVRIVNHAYLYNGREYPSYSKNTLIGFLAGCFFVALFFAIRELLNNTVRSEEYLNDLYNVPILSVIPDLNLERKTSKYGQQKYAKLTADRKEEQKHEIQ